MNILIAALLFFLAWWFAEQGLYFFSLVFIIVLVMMALASGQKAPAPAGAPAAGYGAAPAANASKQWDNRQLEDFGRNLARVVEIPLRIVWGIVRWLWERK